MQTNKPKTLLLMSHIEDFNKLIQQQSSSVHKYSINIFPEFVLILSSAKRSSILKVNGMQIN